MLHYLLWRLHKGRMHEASIQVVGVSLSSPHARREGVAYSLHSIHRIAMLIT
jgi:hypothetical protein